MKVDQPHEWYKNVLHDPKYIVAPMVNQGELPFRILCKRHGAHLAYTPMFHSRLFKEIRRYREQQFQTIDGDLPLIAQFCGDNPEDILEATLKLLHKEKWDSTYYRAVGYREEDPNLYSKILENTRMQDSQVDHVLGPDDLLKEDYVEEDTNEMIQRARGLSLTLRQHRSRERGKYKKKKLRKKEEKEEETEIEEQESFQSKIKAIDLNLGCPQGIARKGHYGAYLMEEPKVIENIISGVSASNKIDIPLTVKIRIFPELQDTLQYTSMIEKSGASLLAVHGRTRSAKNSGLANWDTIKLIREQCSSIPILSNGNIQCRKDVHDCIEHTGVSGVLSAQGVLDYPAMFEDDDPHFKPVYNATTQLYEPRPQIDLCHEYLNIWCSLDRLLARVDWGLRHVYYMLHWELSQNIEYQAYLSAYLSKKLDVEQYMGIIEELRHRTTYNCHFNEKKFFENKGVIDWKSQLDNGVPRYSFMYRHSPPIRQDYENYMSEYKAQTECIEFRRLARENNNEFIEELSESINNLFS